jgi:hypothetical protein
MTYFPYVNIYDPHGKLMSKVTGQHGFKTKKQAKKEADKITLNYLHADKKVPIGSHAIKEILSKRELKERENNISEVIDFDFGDYFR